MKRLPSWSLAMAGVLALAFSLALAGSAAARPHAGSGTITGKVVDSSGQPVAGAFVRIAMLPPRMNHHWKHHGQRPGRIEPGQTVWHTSVFGVTKTADDGTFTVNNARPGRYRIFAMKRGVGFGHLRRPIKVSNGSTPVSAGTITLHMGKPHHGHGRRHGPPAPGN